VRICAGFVGVDHAEDVVQDAYVRGRARIGQLRDVDLFDAWIARIAINLCVNRHRRSGRLRGLLGQLVPRQPAGPRDIGLRELIERLPDRERTVLVLHYGHGYQLDEIARLANLTPTNVRTIVFRARRRLADELDRADR
jgi:RNA polymerase sigma-70 factor (ECF subfamily)